MIKKLQKKFIRITMISVTAVLIFLGLVLNLANFISVDSSNSDMLELIFSNQGTLPAPPNSIPKASFPRNYSVETPHMTRFFIIRYNSNGELFNSDLTSIASVSENEIQTYVNKALKENEGMGYYNGYKYYIVKHSEDRFMAVFLDCSNELAEIRKLAFLTLLTISGCIILVYFIVYLLSLKAIRPIVNNIERQKQFITDASHELKTPLTVIRTCTSVLKMDMPSDKWLNKIDNQTEKMNSLVISLVSLSRLDEEHPPFSRSEFNISSALEEIVDSFSDIADRNSFSINCDITDGIEYRGDEYLIRQLFSILIDNAVRHSSVPGEINIEMKSTYRGILLKISNPSENIPKDKLARFFDRFYQLDSSRSSDNRGFGIGLSMAYRISELHSGSISVEMQSPDRILFTVELKM